MFGLGPLELGIILVICVLLFGARRLPELGSGIGEAIRNFKSGLSEEKKEIDVTPESSDESVRDGKSGP
ncbi:MAG: twin-arginine translocase TatA/TatE family subunit [Myxococcota bacterium]|nr:twin-arginine translocase TatA/TatE family subunit [Myxococcota bacterium]